MAQAVPECRQCGKTLAPGDKFCPQCGTRVEEHPSSAGAEPARVYCEVCGHENSHGGAYCEACGVKLPPAASRLAKPYDRETAAKSAKQKVTRRKFEPWQYMAAIVAVGLIGMFAYIELQRDHGDAHVHSDQPASQPAATPPSKEVLETIDRLQKTVNDNPNDIGSKLLLANALHDAAMHDMGLFPRAIDAYKTYLKEKPGDPNARVDLGICYFELGKMDTIHAGRLFTLAINEMETAVKNAPNHQPGAFNLGIVHLYAGNLKESNRWFRRTIELNAESDLGKRAKAILEQHNQAG